MSGLWEHPWAIVFVGLMTTLLLAGGFFRTGHRWLLAGTILAGSTTAALWMLERAIVTPGEQVRQMLHQVAGSLERNDAAAVLNAIAPTATQLRAEVARTLPQAEILKASIKPNLKVELDTRRPPQTAVATFNAVVTLRDRRGDWGGEHRLPYFVTVQLRRYEDQWKVEDYQLEDPREGFR